MDKQSRDEVRALTRLRRKRRSGRRNSHLCGPRGKKGLYIQKVRGGKKMAVFFEVGGGGLEGKSKK